jgi:predicted ribosomally synthesized peptide with SipW-like signal peptide
MRKIFAFTFIVGILFLTSATLSYFYDIESTKAYFNSGHWASELVPGKSGIAIKTHSGNPGGGNDTLIVVFEGEEGVAYKINDVFRILDAPGVPELSVESIDFASVNLGKDINDFVVGLEIEAHESGIYEGYILIKYPTYPFKNMKIPLKIILEGLQNEE